MGRISVAASSTRYFQPTIVWGTPPHVSKRQSLTVDGPDQPRRLCSLGRSEGSTKGGPRRDVGAMVVCTGDTSRSYGLLESALLFSLFIILSAPHPVCLFAHVYVLMRHDNHVCYTIADLALRPLVGVNCPSPLFRVYGIPTFLSEKDVAPGPRVYKEG